jgi:saccharopine dehydrogenase (NADP+, L-glutamate forming)
MAGQAGAAYKENNTIIKKDYSHVFENSPQIKIDALPTMAWYPNRDSLSYIPLYHLEEASTFIRTTLRYTDFCKGWDVIVDLGLTNEQDAVEIKQHKTYHDWFASKLKQVEQREMSLRMYLELYVPEANHDKILQQFEFLELDTIEALPVHVKSSADILQSRVEPKLALKPTDKDLIVMLHEIEYITNTGEASSIHSTLVVKGEDSLRTAMAKTVGLPLGIAAKLILEEKIKLKGLHIPTHKEIYEPVLEELKANGIQFHEKHL